VSLVSRSLVYMSTVYSLDLVISDESFIENIELDAPIGKSDHCTMHI